MTRYYFNKTFYPHFAQLATAYFRAKGHYPMKAEKTQDSKGCWVLAYK